MKRDYELIRKILLLLEKDDYPVAVIRLHIELMLDAGLLNITRNNISITQSGHDFLDLCRPDERWNKVMEKVKEANGVPFDLLIGLLTREARTKRKEEMKTVFETYSQPAKETGRDRIKRWIHDIKRWFLRSSPFKR
jgi:hypothetical protein